MIKLFRLVNLLIHKKTKFAVPLKVVRSKNPDFKLQLTCEV